MSRREDIQRLILTYNRRLQVLKEQQALHGLSTPPEIVLEIENIEVRLEDLQTTQDSLEGNVEPTRQARVMADRDIEQELARAGLSLPPQKPTQSGGINISGISGGTINVGGGMFTAGNVKGDVTGRDKVVENIAGDKVGRDKIAGTLPGAEPSAQEILEAALAQWKQEIEAKIEAQTDLDPDDKENLKKTAAKVEAEVTKGSEADPGKVAKWLNVMSAMAPDILEVTAKTLQNPFAGVGLVLEKINDRINLERSAQ